jgi:hypothetical protein
MTLRVFALAAAVGAATLSSLTLSTLNASAAIACSGNVCWHTHERYEYPTDARVVIHPDDWKWEPHERFGWREHEGRGYWRGERWIEW